MIKSVQFLSEPEACALSPSPGLAVISITDPGIYRVPLQDGWSPLLRVYMPDAGCDERMLEFIGGYENYLATGFPNHRHALQIRAFVDELHSAAQAYDLIVHCHAGRSRSVAVAMYVAELCSLSLSGDCSRHNQTVLNLMRRPYYYAPPGYAQKVVARESTWERICRLIGITSRRSRV